MFMLVSTTAIIEMTRR